tara:strand:- start:70 stop:222 length:153 start_codon:yes stop_codon:yes gene_type:complete
MPVSPSSVEMNVIVFAVDAGSFSANSGEAIRNMALVGAQLCAAGNNLGRS